MKRIVRKGRRFGRPNFTGESGWAMRFGTVTIAQLAEFASVGRGPIACSFCNLALRRFAPKVNEIAAVESLSFRHPACI